METLIATSTAGRWQQRLHAVPPIAWLGLHAAALWTHWRWAGARLADGSDDPLGLAALAVLAWMVLRLAPDLRGNPRPAWMAAALALSVFATVAVFAAPPLVGALLAVLALACGLRAFIPDGRPTLGLAGLAVLSLPIVSSLQFYAGHPLRVVTAQASTWLLQLGGMDATREGTAMRVDGQLVIVDAPCSGVQMVWLAYFTACTAAAWLGVADRRLLRCLPWVGLAVMAGNVARNTVLVAMEATGTRPGELMHQAVGLWVLGVVCLGVVAIVRRAGHGDR